jgi:hypothetical protein
VARGFDLQLAQRLDVTRKAPEGDSSTTSTAERCMLVTEGSAGQGKRRRNTCRIGRRVTIALPNSRRPPCGAGPSVATPFTTL